MKIKKLKEISTIIDGVHKTPKYTKEGVRFISVENIEDPYKSEKFISKEDYDKNYKIKADYNDIFMTRIGVIGKCFLHNTNDDLAYYVTLALIKPNQDEIESKYLKLYLESNTGSKELYKKTLHTAVPIKINLKDIGEINVSIPSLSVQKEIVEKLSIFEQYIKNLRDELSLRKKQLKYFYRMIFNENILNEKNFHYSPLEKLVFITLGKQLNRSDMSSEYSIPVFNGGISESGYWKESNTKANTITISQGGNSTGFVNFIKEPFWAGAHCYTLLSPNPEINYNYLYHFLKSSEDSIMKLRKGGGIPGLNRKDIQNFMVPIINIDKQKEIADNLDNLNEYINLLKEEIYLRQKQYEYYRDKLLDFSEEEIE